MESPNLPEPNQVTDKKIKLPKIPNQIIPDFKTTSKIIVSIQMCGSKSMAVSNIWSQIQSQKTNVSRAIFWSGISPFLYSVTIDLLAANIVNPLAENPCSCSGFILFSYSTSIYLWNPSIRSCQEVLQILLVIVS